MSKKVIYVISDATGQRGLHILRAALVQFEHARAKIMLFHDIDTKAALKKLLEQARAVKPIIAFTFVKKEMRDYVAEYCKKNDILCLDILGPLINNLASYLHLEPLETPSLLRKVDEQYFKRIDAIEVLLPGSVWESLKGTPSEKARKIVFVVVNAETEPDRKWDRTEKIPPFGAMASAYSSVGIERYNQETLALLEESVKSWANEIKTGRCKGGAVSTAPGSCGDINFYVVEVKFDALRDETERLYFKRLPTSFKLSDEEVDKLRDVAHRILNESEEFRRLLSDLR